MFGIPGMGIMGMGMFFMSSSFMFGGNGIPGIAIPGMQPGIPGIDIIPVTESLLCMGIIGTRMPGGIPLSLHPFGSGIPGIGIPGIQGGICMPGIPLGIPGMPKDIGICGGILQSPGRPDRITGAEILRSKLGCFCICASKPLGLSLLIVVLPLMVLTFFCEDLR
jgi:hypothetical protein